ncbi:histone-lysine N-methyltransferase set-26-like [Impatiens glandulifera]|uniref:histone-lysine N-methyltransferase set-26-like n=1 Tax=Impatiens glandulifera TaxID=253017 RepID=UPI001FB1627E|nr:histone-lysine N-methyltransferase set-26-like [Impatiens glandulifera]XP_047323397.1 histone-lysine N-methyltransferase set-26-like [Impatiens glandulifera]
MGSNGYLDINDQRPSVDSDHRHHQSRHSTGKPMLLNDSKRSKSNPRRHSSIISASAKITHNNNIIPSPNYLRASTGSCHDFCKFGRKKLSEEVKPWRCIQKQSTKVENFPQKHADTSVIKVLPEKVDEDDATEKEKSFCEKIEAEKKMKVFNRKPTVAVESKPKAWISQKDIVIKNTERVEKKLVVDQPADFGRIKPIIKLGKSLDVSKAPAAATSKTQKPPSPSPSAAASRSQSAAASQPSSAAASWPSSAAASRPSSAAASRPQAAAAASRLQAAAAASRLQAAAAASRPQAPAASRPNKLVSTKSLAKTNGTRNSSPQQQQQPVIKKRMVGIPEVSKNNVKSKSQEKPIIKQIVESEKNPAVESNENGYRIIHEEESNNENSQQKMDQIVESEKNPAVESNENGYMIHEEESNNENSQQKMDQIAESEEKPSVESNENGDTMEVEELSEDEDDDETEEDEYEYEYENSINSQSSSEEEGEEVEKEETFNGGKRPKKIAVDNNGSEDGVKLKFRRGRVVDIEAGKDSPRRLKFRRGRVENPAEGRSSVKIRNFRKRTTTTVTNNEDLDSEIIMLRHQDVEEKKDAQGLFNNVIEETASKLVEARKSKVKALVGAFETVISLQETTTSNTKYSSPQTLIS